MSTLPEALATDGSGAACTFETAFGGGSVATLGGRAPMGCPEAVGGRNCPISAPDAGLLAGTGHGR